MSGEATDDAHTALGEGIARGLASTRSAREDLVRALYEQPETGFAEHASAEAIAALVERSGIAVERGSHGLPTAFRATVGAAGGSREGPHVTIIAEYDALPGVGHACGHNIIAGIAVGAFLAAAPHADGGAAPNIVLERASALFYARSAEIDELWELTDRVIGVLEGAAQITGTRAEIVVDPVPPYLPLRTNVALARRYAAAMAARGRAVPPSPAAVPQGGPSTDMGNVSQVVPAIHPTIGLGGPPDVVPHNAAFADLTVLPAAFDAMEDAAAAVARAALDVLSDSELRAAVRAEFLAAGGAYRWGGGGVRASGRT